jgi:iron complex outermembrane receptor protein
VINVRSAGRFWITGILSLLLVQGAQGQTAHEEEPIELAPVTVTASPIIEGNEADRYACITTRVTEQQIIDLNAQDLASALRRTPGVTISRFNPIGSFGGGEGGAVFIRGMGASRPGAEIKTFVDGVPMYMGVWNHPLLDLLSIDSTRSIEVLKSPQPQRFGDAFAVINLMPKRHTAEGFRTRTEVAGGNFQTFVGTVEHGGKLDGFDYLAGAGYRRSDGHRSHAAGRTLNGYASLGQQLGRGWDLRLFTLLSDNRVQDPGAEDAPAEQRQGTYETRAWLTTLTLAHEHEAAEGFLKLYANVGEGDWLGQPTGTVGVTEDLFNDFVFYGVRARETLRPWTESEIVIGVDLNRTEGDFNAEFSDGTEDRWSGHEVTLLSPYLALSYEFGDREGFFLVPSAGLRFYDNSDFSSEWSPHAGVMLGYGPTALHAGYARGVVYPGLDVVVFSEKVIPGLGDSWKDLRAERTDHFEIGARHWFGEVVVADLTLFHDEGRDRYVVVPPPPPPPVFANLEAFTIRGLEATVTVFPHPEVSVFAGLTLLDTDPSDLPYAPSTTVAAGLNWRLFEALRLSVDSQYVSEMYVNSRARRAGAASTEKVDPYFLLNAKLSCRVTPGAWDFEGKVFVAGENLTDTDYELRPGYPMPGISWMLGVESIF